MNAYYIYKGNAREYANVDYGEDSVRDIRPSLTEFEN